jgi:hypothetical protein
MSEHHNLINPDTAVVTASENMQGKQYTVRYKKDEYAAHGRLQKFYALVEQKCCVHM